MHLSSEVESALASNKSIVALESTVIAHGLPRPQNLETARRLEQIVREEGAVPATIGVIGGKLCVGLDENQVELLANSSKVRKLSTRDLAIAVPNVGTVRPRWRRRYGLRIVPESAYLRRAALAECI